MTTTSKHLLQHAGFTICILTIWLPPFLFAHQIGEFLAVTRSPKLSNEVADSHVPMVPNPIIAVSMLTSLLIMSLLLSGTLFSPPNQGICTRESRQGTEVPPDHACILLRTALHGRTNATAFWFQRPCGLGKSYKPHTINETLIKVVPSNLASEHSVDLQRNMHGLQTCRTQLSFVNIGHFASVNGFNTRITLQLSVDGSNLYNSMIKPSVFLFLAKHCPSNRSENTWVGRPLISDQFRRWLFLSDFKSTRNFGEISRWLGSAHKRRIQAQGNNILQRYRRWRHPPSLWKFKDGCHTIGDVKPVINNGPGKHCSGFGALFFLPHYSGDTSWRDSVGDSRW